MRPKATNKYKMLQEKDGTVIVSYPRYSPFLGRYVYDDRPPNQLDRPEYEGSGGSFLPGDIRGLRTKLTLLLAEFRAGNTSTRNQIVFILDELLRRKQMSRKEYTEINNYVSNRT